MVEEIDKAHGDYDGQVNNDGMTCVNCDLSIGVQHDLDMAC